MTVKYNLVFILLLYYLLAGCQIVEYDGSEPPSHRTYYDSMNLSTPEAAIETFVQAFQRRDFVTVYLILAPAAQQVLVVNREIRDVLGRDSAIAMTSPEGPSEEFLRAWTRQLQTREHIYDTLHNYDLMLATAAGYSALQIDLPGEVVTVSTSNSLTTSGQPALDVTTRVDGIDGVVVFRMVQSPSEKWRVFQVIWPSGDESEVPWAVPPEYVEKKSEGVQQLTTNHQPRTYYDSLALSTPEAAVRTFTQAFQERDFPTVFWVLHPNAQQQWWRHFGLKRFENLVRTSNPSQILWSTEFGRNLHALVESGTINKDESFLTFLEMSGSLGYKGSPHTPLVMEHIGDTSYLFDQVMLAANEQYLIDLRGQVTIGETRLRKTVDGEMIATVIATLAGVEGEVSFRLKQSPTGRWRVLQVIVPGGDEEKYPWAAVN
jgi:limonene-1,2-epoxide hydrolase